MPRWGKCSFATETLKFPTDSRVLYLWVKKLAKFYHVGIVELSVRVYSNTSKVSLGIFELQRYINIGSQLFVSISIFVKLIKVLFTVRCRFFIAQPVS